MPWELLATDRRYLATPTPLVSPAGWTSRRRGGTCTWRSAADVHGGRPPPGRQSRLRARGGRHPSRDRARADAGPGRGERLPGTLRDRIALKGPSRRSRLSCHGTIKNDMPQLLLETRGQRDEVPAPELMIALGDDKPAAGVPVSCRTAGQPARPYPGALPRRSRSARRVSGEAQFTSGTLPRCAGLFLARPPACAQSALPPRSPARRSSRSDERSRAEARPALAPRAGLPGRQWRRRSLRTGSASAKPAEISSLQRVPGQNRECRRTCAQVSSPQAPSTQRSCLGTQRRHRGRTGVW